MHGRTKLDATKGKHNFGIKEIYEMAPKKKAPKKPKVKKMTASAAARKAGAKGAAKRSW